MLQWSLQVFASNGLIDQICLVLPEDLSDVPLEAGNYRLATGGRERTDSVRNGLARLDAEDNDIVLIHDAARPGLDHDTISELITAIETADAAAPALPVLDALKRASGRQLETVERSGLYRIQTPQAFRYHQISAALNDTSLTFVDDLEAVEHAGAVVKLVSGKETLSKVTLPEDFARMETMLNPSLPSLRMGSGFDVHAFESGDGVTLCGIRIPHEQKLKGHSDADVGWHALTDAIFGALALGDLGDHFPPSDDRWKDTESGVFLQHAISLAAERGWSLSNCDITLICEAPKIKPHRDAMRQETARLTGLDIDAVSIKATTTEGLGFTGRKEGIAAQATAVLSRRTPDRS